MRLALVLLLMFAGSAQARLVTFDYALPGVDCDGNPVAASAVELVVDTVPIAASDADCPAPGAAVDLPPSGAQTYSASAPSNNLGSIDVDLDPGATYYARMRVQGPNSVWSNLSPQKTVVMPNATPSGAIRITITQ